MTSNEEILRRALRQAGRKLVAYVGVCKHDKELTESIIPLVREALEATSKEDEPGPERFGKRRVDRMYADMNKLREAIRAEGTDTIQNAWDRVEECIDFAYRGCPECRSTHGPSQDMAE